MTVAPHADWQGEFVGGSLMDGSSQAPCTGASGCPLIDWPGGKMTTDGVVPTPVMRAWWGSLLQSRVDGSGLRYQRNRYYDPLTGQFTQADPIGLAGGINLYALAGGIRSTIGIRLGCAPRETSTASILALSFVARKAECSSRHLMRSIDWELGTYTSSPRHR